MLNNLQQHLKGKNVYDFTPYTLLVLLKKLALHENEDLFSTLTEVIECAGSLSIPQELSEKSYVQSYCLVQSG